MPTYKHILLATSLSSYSHSLALYANSLAQDFGARLSLLHVLERLRSQNNSENTEKVARRELLKLGKELIVPEFDQRTVIGDTGKCILTMAQDLFIDLIVIGQNENSRSSLGSTALAILEGASCDVITVRGDS